MSAQRGKKTPPKQGKQKAPPPRPAATEVQPISSAGLIISIFAALVIAGVLLFVINTRMNAARPAAQAPTPTVVAAANPPAATVPAAQQPASSSTTLGGFSKGNAQAKVTVVEYSDYK
jgi:protein-disulfide isomerase